MSVEGAADMGKSGHAHTDHASEHVSAVTVEAASDVDANHCDHCCHGHFSGITSPIVSSHAFAYTSEHQSARKSIINNFGHAPPTPPPTA